jgi:hypothetical protein
MFPQIDSDFATRIAETDDYHVLATEFLALAPSKWNQARTDVDK